MTVQPGMKGQKFIADTLEKIRAAHSYIKQLERNIDIEVDGDITLTHLTEVLGAGANIVVVGKALFQGILEDNIRNYQLAG